MKTCPACKKEYEGDICPECSYDMRDEQQSINNWVHLTTASDDIELEIFAGLLESGGIPSLSKSIGIDKYVGVPLAGLELLVPANRLEEARAVLAADFCEEDFPQGEEPEE